MVWNGTVSDDRTSEWLAEHGDFSRNPTPPEARNSVSRFSTSELPDAWSWMATQPDVLGIKVPETSVAEVVFIGSQEEIGNRIQAWDGPGSTLKVQEITNDGQLLTNRQHLVLARAAALGFDNIPRAIRLQVLANLANTTKSSISGLVRRAKGRLVRAYLSHGGGQTNDQASGESEDV